VRRQGRHSIRFARVIAITAEIGHEPAPVLARAQSAENKASLCSETEEAQRLGIFGAPSLVVAGELFWGNDRLDEALAWATGDFGPAMK
jgi:2-hydroxychromene-2-carboxylate isomerase